MPDPTIKDTIVGAIDPGVDEIANQEQDADKQYPCETTQDEFPSPAPPFSTPPPVGRAMNAGLALKSRKSLSALATLAASPAIC